MYINQIASFEPQQLISACAMHLDESLSIRVDNLKDLTVETSWEKNKSKNTKEKRKKRPHWHGVRIDSILRVPEEIVKHPYHLIRLNIQNYIRQVTHQSSIKSRQRIMELGSLLDSKVGASVRWPPFTQPCGEQSADYSFAFY